MTAAAAATKLAAIRERLLTEEVEVLALLSEHGAFGARAELLALKESIRVAALVAIVAKDRVQGGEAEKGQTTKGGWNV